MATLIPDYIKEKTGIEPHIGLLRGAENCPPDYSLSPNLEYSTVWVRIKPVVVIVAATPIIAPVNAGNLFRYAITKKGITVTLIITRIELWKSGVTLFLTVRRIKFIIHSIAIRLNA